MKLFVGLDVSYLNLDACFLTDDESLTILKEKCFEDSAISTDQIKKLILAYAQDYDLAKVVIGMEATSLYSFCFLKQTKTYRSWI